MRRRASIAGCGFALLALAGCANIRPRGGDDALSASQAAQCRQLSESAQAAIDRGDYERARADLQRLVAESPRSVEAFHRLGRVLHHQGRPTEAQAAYQHALSLDPEYVGALIGIGDLENRFGRLDLALQRFETALEIDPQQSEAHFGRGRVLQEMGRNDEALAAYFRALELDPSSAPVNLRIAILQLSHNQPDQALARLDQVLELAPDDPVAHDQRGLAHLALGHSAEAINDFRFAARRSPNRADLFYHLALALNAEHKRPEALQAAQRALTLSPGYADARVLSQRLRR